MSATPYSAFPNRFKQDLRDGKRLIGCWVSLANPITTEVLGLAGFDWLLLDGEHSPNDIASFVLQLMALKGVKMDEIRNVTPSYAGIGYDRIEQQGIHWPCPNEEHPGTPILHREQFTIGRGVFNAIDYFPPAETVDGDRPVLVWFWAPH